MQYFDTPQRAQAWCAKQRTDGFSIGYVPTMGALHEGHLSLVQRSVHENHRTVVSIFVNPLQFNNPEDLKQYPDTMADDQAMLSQAGCDVVYSGQLSDFFPGENHEENLAMQVPCSAISGLEAKHRPGHLEGVQAIVDKLFDVVGGSKAYFGEKDFQQTLVVKELAERRRDTEVVVCETVREADGLAMSSRNRRMNSAERQQAKSIYQALKAADQLWNNGERLPEVLEQSMQNELRRNQQIRIDYAAIRDPLKWTENTPQNALHQAQALIAAYCGDIRLIDNCELGTLSP